MTLPVSLRLDAAIAQLRAEPMDRLAAATVTRFHDALTLRRNRAVALDPPGLRGALMDFAMPDLTDPQVLRGDNALAVLRELQDDIAAAGDPQQDSVAADLRAELERLIRVRGDRNGLIGG